MNLTRLQSQPARLLPPKRLSTPRSASRLSATGWGLLPGAPALTRTGLTPAGLCQLSWRNTALFWSSVSQDDYYASLFGAAFSAYMERPRLSGFISRIFWGADIRPYYTQMSAIGEVPDGGTIVDCPCGAGPALRGLHPAQRVRYLAVDLSPSMLRRAGKRARARRLTAVEPLEASATDIPLPAEGADLFLSLWGLHCFEDPLAALGEASRVLKPGGRLVGSCFVLGGNNLRSRLLLKPHTGDFGPIGTEAEFDVWLKRAGFERIAKQRSGPMLFFEARATADARKGVG